jgi:quinoprotein dehydrogenase-associated probable ABC transporter substrate-binding protein
MCSRYLSLLLPLGALLASCRNPDPVKQILRVCSDPNNLPFSNEKEEGFENKLANLIAQQMGARVEYTWHAQRRGFVRNTLNEKKCDVVMGVPNHYDPVDTTRPYYRSTYVFVTRTGEHADLTSIDDPILKDVKIGVHIVGDDYSNPPPVHALGRRNIVRNVTGFSIYGDYSQPNPPARLVEAVADGTVDVAILWGPFGGYFGTRQEIPLTVAAVTPEADGPELPFVFDIAMGVRKGDVEMRDRLQRVMDSRQEEVAAILHDYGIPLLR